MTDAPTLAEWLLERITEDEAAARAVTSGAQWTEGNYWITDYDPSDPSGQTAMQRLIGGMEAPDWQHYSRHDPARVLARCEADRRIVLSMDDLLRAYEREPETGNEVRDEAMLSAANIAEATLRALASVYADRDGFREEWR